jgi:hypothetical protein
MANWQDVSSDARYKKAAPDVQQKIRNDFFDATIASEIPEGVDVEPIRQDFLKRTEPVQEKSFFGKINDAFIGSSSPIPLADKGLLKPQQQISPRKSQTGFTYNPISSDSEMPEITAGSLQAKPAQISKEAAKEKLLTDDLGRLSQLTANGISPKKAAMSIRSDAMRERDAQALSQQSAKNDTLNYAGKLEEKPKRTFTDVAKDVALSTIEIAPTLAKGVADIGNLITGDNVDLGASKEFKDQIEYLDSYKSDATKYEDAEFQTAFNGKNSDSIQAAKVLFENPTLLTTKLIPTIGSMFTPAGVQAGVMKIAPGVLGAKFTPQIAAALQNGSLVGTIAMQNAAETFNDDDIKNLPLEERYKAATITALGTIAGNKIFSGGAEKLIADKFNKTGIAQGFLQIPKAAFNEGMQERVESYSGSLAKEYATPDKMSLDKALADGNVSGLMGTLMGGVVGAGSMTRGKRIIEELKARQSAQTQTNTNNQAAPLTSDATLLDQVNSYTANQNES